MFDRSVDPTVSLHCPCQIQSTRRINDIGGLFCASGAKEDSGAGPQLRKQATMRNWVTSFFLDPEVVVLGYSGMVAVFLGVRGNTVTGN
jgi:hypothetical protein